MKRTGAYLPVFWIRLGTRSAHQAACTLHERKSARRAGMRTLVASYGYIAEQEDTAAWGAEGSIARPAELLDWLDA